MTDENEKIKELLQSAVAIAKRNGDATHWRRFVKQCEKLNVHGVTAKTFRLLQTDVEVDDNGKF